MHLVNKLALLSTKAKRLTWKCHVNELCLKQSKTVGIQSKERHFVDNHVLVMIYYSLIYPFLTYAGVHVLGLTFPSFLTQLLLSRKIRIISFCEPKSHSETHCSNLSTYLSSMMSLNHRYSLLFIIRHVDCYCFSEYFKFTSSVHSYSTRQSCNKNLYVTSVNTTQYGLRSLKFNGPHLWNSLPTSITNSNSLGIFRKTLKNSIFNCFFN